MRLSEIVNEKTESEGKIKVKISFRVNVNGIITKFRLGKKRNNTTEPRI